MEDKQVAVSWDKSYSKKELEEINKFRRKMGMEEIVSKSIPCLRCSKEFNSCDYKRVRFCPVCRRDLTRSEEWDSGCNLAQVGVSSFSTIPQGRTLRGDEKEISE